ncbi:MULTISPECIES: molybdopterin cofactor-binding domain-containing protein [unclassified Variovorax]|uniref:xanthine dehydrogenase family protein molybdopterin-binding subunit n=1 Tax=unclassified Variovorax TaxID=663243 RepID=UPI003F468DB3
MSGTAALPPSLQANPRLSTWLRIDRAGHVAVHSGKVELGQGILGALAQIAAEELDLELAQVRLVPAATGLSPDEAMTSGSLSVQHSGAALRHVCAQARALHLEWAAALHGIASADLRVAGGEIFHGERRISDYWEIAEAAGPALLDVDATALAMPKQAGDYRIVGRVQPRDDIAEKVFCEFMFIHDMVLPRMAHGRIVRPPSPHAELVECPLDEVRAWGGVLAVLRDGSQLGVVAETESLAERVAARLARLAVWTEAERLPDEAALRPWLQSLPSTALEFGSRSDKTAAPAVRTVRASYSKPFIRHASIGPSCALALSVHDGLQVWSHSQGIYNLRKDLAIAFGLPPECIRVQHVQGAGCYGHNGADDAAFDAAWLARACAGLPVRVQWSRADELCWSPVGPAMAIDLEADLDAAGRVVAWRHQSWSPGHGLRPGRGATPTLLGSWYLAQPFEHVASTDAPRAAGGGGDRNADPIYAFPRFDVVCRRVLDVPMRTSALRALGAFANVFAIESFMDELALCSGADPLDYRIAQLDDPRAVAVLRAVSAQAGWQPREVPAGEGRGRGVGFARYKNTGAYCAVVAEVEVDERVHVRRLHIAVDVGLAVNPDGVRQQIEGGALQATSWALMEAAHFDRTRMRDPGWEDYPILRFPDVPHIDVQVLLADGFASLGAGEASLGPTAAAIANAVFDALGVRVRDLPMLPERIVQAMEDMDA